MAEALSPSVPPLSLSQAPEPGSGGLNMGTECVGVLTTPPLRE